MRQLILLALIFVWAGVARGVALGQAAPAEEEVSFQTTVDRLLKAKTVSSESERLSFPYRMAADAVCVAFDQHNELGGNRDPSGLIEATRVLRVVECSRHLAQYVDTRSHAAFGRGPLGVYPAARALIEFGSASYPGIFAQLEHKASEKQLRILALVCLKIDGEKLAHVRLKDRLDEHVGKLKFPGVDDDLAANLRRLCEIIRTVDFSKPENWP